MQIQTVKKNLYIWMVILFFFLPAYADADLMKKIAQDFAPVSGCVVAVTDQGDCVIDADASKNVSVGDIFQVFAKGTSLIHPISGEKIGDMEKPIGALKVTQLQTGYAYARILKNIQKIERGQIIRRFEGTAAFFWDASGRYEALSAELRHTLPFLSWQHTDRDQKAIPKTDSISLWFAVSDSRLEVRDSESDVIQSYSLPSLPVSAAPPKSSAAKASAPAVPETVTSSPVFAPQFQQHQMIGEFPERIICADFLRTDSKLLMAAAGDSNIHLFHVEEKMNPLSSVNIFPRKICMIKWWQPSEKAEPYLAVTAWNENKVESEIYAVRGNQMKAVQRYIPYMLGTFDRDENGSPETLLCQNFDRDIVWGKMIRQMILSGETIKSTNSDIELPSDFSVTGSVFADLTGDGVQETVFVRGSTLKIFSGNKQIYKISGIGGSISALTYNINPEQQAVLTKTVCFEISPAVAVFNKDGSKTKTLIATTVNRSMLSMPSVYSGFRNVQLALFKYQNNNFIQGTLGETLPYPVQGMAVDGNRIFFVQTSPETLGGKENASHLYAYTIAGQ